MELKYNKEVDRKWQKIWKDTNLYRFDINSEKPKLYLMEMFSYPSASKLHLGHWWNYSLPDSWGRMKRMQGYNVFHPMGFDAFGLPAENYAIKTGIHPKDSTESNISTMERQLSEIGCTYDWNHEIKTCNADYYKWTQWLFLQLYENDLAYKKEALVNWCPKCKTVLANEQVIGNVCERCGSQVEQKKKEQWFLRITKYAEELLNDLDELDWPKKTKSIQKNWIGKKTGIEVSFKVKGTDEIVKVFTTRIDTLLGVSCIVLAPESEYVKKITKPEQRQAVEAYIRKTLLKKEIERINFAKNAEKTGVFIGAYVIHPLTGKEIQVWISDYVLASYDTGAVMVVPAHDKGDYAFARQHNLPIYQVITNKELNAKIPFCEKGIAINCGKYNGMTYKQIRNAIVEDLKMLGMGKEKTTYRLRDWSVSRQRYWGTPIPLIHCEHCGIVPVPEKALPIELPYNVEFHPTGDSPLASCKEFVHTICPVCGGEARRETDTLDTFLCSSWYQLRYLDNREERKPWGDDTVNKIMPVDKYVGGVEHAAMHLLYCRFIYKALRDMGYVKGDEPYTSLIHQGVILGTDGTRMSKSKGNVIAPDEYVEKYGSDVFRTYLAFGFEYSVGGIWKDSGIVAISNFFKRLTKMVESYLNLEQSCDRLIVDSETNSIQHHIIKLVTHDIENFHFNTAIARLMEFNKAIMNYQKKSDRNALFERQMIENFIKMIGVFAPHYGEELWQIIGNEYSLFEQKWPEYDERQIAQKEYELVIQINGKIRQKIEVAENYTEKELEKIVFSHPKIKEELTEKNIKKVILIKKRLINIVID